MAQDLTIGKVARAAGVNVETVRYYQRSGLIPEPPRPLGGVRRYSGETVARLRFIRRAQELGFTLAEIRRLRRDARPGDLPDHRDARRALSENAPRRYWATRRTVIRATGLRQS